MRLAVRARDDRITGKWNTFVGKEPVYSAVLGTRDEFIVLRARVPPYLYGEYVRSRSRHYGSLCVVSHLRTCFLTAWSMVDRLHVGASRFGRAVPERREGVDWSLSRSKRRDKVPSLLRGVRFSRISSGSDVVTAHLVHLPLVM